MWIDIILLLIGLGLLVAGGSFVTDGSSSIARRLHMSGLMVGVTIVALGSAAPDLVVGVVSTLNGKSQLAMGDVVGANLFDFLLVVGVIALVRPIEVTRPTLIGDFPVAVLACWMLFFLADDILIDGASANVLNRGDGLVMLCGVGLFMAYAISASKCPADTMASTLQTGAAKCEGSACAASPRKEMAAWKGVALIVAGLGALVLGGQWVVDGASGIAKHFGMSEAMVGLTIVAIGSSLPDLATSLVAALKNQPGIALGNIIGGCIYNVLLVLGTCSVIKPIDGGDITQVDFITLVGAATLVWIFAATGKKGKHVIDRAEGAILVCGYIAYMAYLVLAK